MWIAGHKTVDLYHSLSAAEVPRIMLLGGDSRQTFIARKPHILHLPESARKLLEAYLQLADWNQLRRLGEGHSKPLKWATSPEIVEWQAKQPLPTAPPAHTSQLIIDLLHEPSEVVLMEELDSIKKILDPKTPIVWLKEILSSELWEEELFQGGDVPLPPGLQMTWNQLSHHLGQHHQIPEDTIIQDLPRLQ